MNKEIYKHLPTVDYDVVKRALSSSNPLTVIKDFVSGIEDASNETRQLIIEQYMSELESYDSNYTLGSVSDTQNVTDNILPKAISDSSDSLSDSLEDKLMGSQPSGRRKFISRTTGISGFSGIKMFHEAPHNQITLIPGAQSYGKVFMPPQLKDGDIIQLEMDPQTVSDRFKAAFEFVEKQRNANRICVVTSGDSELEAKILGSIPRIMQCDVDVIHLKSTEDELQKLNDLIATYGTVVMDNQLSDIEGDSLMGGEAFKQRVEHLARVTQDEESFLQFKPYHIEDIKYDPKFDNQPSPIFNPKQHGKKKGGFKASAKGYNPGFRRR